MCNFLLVGAPRGILADAARPARDLQLRRISAQSLPGVFPSDLDAFFVTSGQCSCGLYFRSEMPDKVDRREIAYRRKGWSDAKIRRALAQVDHAEQTHAQTPGLRADVRALLQEWFTARQRLVFGFFGTRGDPTADIPTTMQSVSLKDLTSDSFEPGDRLLLVDRESSNVTS